MKLHLQEPGSERILELVEKRNEVIVSSTLGKMETVAAFHRNYREGLLTRPALLKVQEQFHREIETGRLTWLPMSPAVEESVYQAFLQLPASVFLRTGDAIHLATASEAGFREIYSNDRHLLAAAGLFKLKGINPLSKSR